MSKQTPKQKLKGIGGWLILFIVCLLIYSVQVLRGIFMVYVPYFSEDWSPLFYEIGFYFSFVLLIFIIASNILLFNSSHLTPKIIIIFFFVYLIYAFISIPITDGFETLKAFVVYFVFVGIWTPYFIFSKRVKNTFVKKRN